MAAKGPYWQFWIDRGGTFTDVVAKNPNGEMTCAKLLSDDPEHYDDAALEGIRRALGLKTTDPIPAAIIDTVKMGTTVATNALLERKGEPTALVTTKGFADALRIGYQNRPDLFALNIRLPELLHSHTIEAVERMAADGEVVTPLDVEALTRDMEAAYGEGYRSVAIVFMHGYRYPEHELATADIAETIGFSQISVSHKVSPLMKLVSRGDTTVVDAYLSPILGRYVDRVAGELGQTRLLFMQSNGGLTDAHMFHGKDSILSGPAGGVVGMARTAEAAGFSKIIGFDMGGTSTDVSHYDGEFERTLETEIAGVRMRAPMMNIHTVAAGGGSILSFDGARFQVGPDSAGALPGPACYRRGGPLTVTDCNVMLGKIQPSHFPHVFGANAEEALDAEVVKKGFGELAADIHARTGDKRTPEQVAEGFLDIAIDNMANAIRKISVQRGHDITEYVINCFGGAGGQHACRLADALGVKRVLVHPLAGVLSALGMGLADMAALRERTMEAAPDDSRLAAVLGELETQARAELAAEGVTEEAITVIRNAHIRYQGTDTALPVAFADAPTMAAEFAERHRKRFGFIMAGRELIVETLSVEAIGASGGQPERIVQATGEGGSGPMGPMGPVATVAMVSGGESHPTPVYQRHHLPDGTAINGPAIIVEDTGTTVVEAGWRADINNGGLLLVSAPNGGAFSGNPDLKGNRSRAFKNLTPVANGASDIKPDPVMLEIFNNLFMSIAEQMGAVLANTAHSVNIKERLDFSCAVFDTDGGLIANAPHIPVHLGSMGESVTTVIERTGEGLKPGDVYVLNDPYNGGSHLPDVTVVTPVFNSTGSRVLFYVASRGHHADIGGMTPGSMPPDSTTLDQEGVLIDCFHLIEDGRMREAEMRALLQSGEFPARNPDQNMADLRAQVAANEKGVAELGRMVEHFGVDMVTAYMDHVQDNAEAAVRRVIDCLNDGDFRVEMDNGASIAVAITIDHQARTAKVDFSGTSGQQADNFNAPFAVTRAAVLYVLRTLVSGDIPLNAGCLKPVDIIIPDGCLLNPRPPGAVVAGNVETSQAVVDTLYGALGVMAASQGTMNNLTFGDAGRQYYETICGGTGAGNGFDGADAVHSHMTNSRLTDPEVLEWRFPVRLENFAIRSKSGGAGRWRGGDGVVREIRFLEPMAAAILSNRRSTQPHGLGGGEAGRCGNNRIRRSDGSVTELAATAQVDVRAGDSIVIETPGGGGFGADTGQSGDK